MASSPKRPAQHKQSAQPSDLRPDEERLIRSLRRAQTDTERHERLLEAILTEDEADLIISLRRERAEKPIPWERVKAELLSNLEP